MPSQAEIIAALRGQPGAVAPAMGAPAVTQALQGNQQIAGDVVRPPLMMFNGSMDPNELYNRILQQPSGAAAVKSMGGAATKPPNILPISPAVQKQMSNIPQKHAFLG